MVKGVAKQAVIVRPQEGRSFEQAIFILGEEPGASVRTPAELLDLAGRLAAQYCTPTAVLPRRKPSALLRGLLWFLCGCAAVGLVWWCTSVFGV